METFSGYYWRYGLNALILRRVDLQNQLDSLVKSGYGESNIAKDVEDEICGLGLCIDFVEDFMK